MLRTAGIDLSDFLAAEIAVVDAAGAIVHCNRQWDQTAKAGGLARRPSGWNYIAECEAAVRRGCKEAGTVLDGLRAVMKGQSTCVATYACPFDALYHWFQVVMSSVDIEGQRHVILMHIDVSTLQIDPLTRLPNRAMFDAQLALVLATAKAATLRTGIIVVDMNNLKLINDIHGHQTGDAAIMALAAELKNKAGAGCVVARLGGDEFGVVLPANFDTLFARRIQAHFKDGISASIGSAPNGISVAASVGIAMYPEDGATARDLFKSADRSMYAQKQGASVA